MASSSLLALAADNNLAGFKAYLDDHPSSLIDDVERWQGKHHTLLMVAVTNGSLDVLTHILTLSSAAQVNRRCGSHKMSALHCAASGNTPNALEIVKVLLEAGADPDLEDAFGRRPVDLAFTAPSDIRRELRDTLNCRSVYVKHGDATDEFWMYTFKVRACPKLYPHDWLECSYAHPHEYGRRRDPRKRPYSWQLCRDFKDGSCPRGEGCDQAHGVFESWLHPGRFRTRMCKKREICLRRVCFFAHSNAELRDPPSAAASTSLDGEQQAVGAHDCDHDREVKQQVQNSRLMEINSSVCFDQSHPPRTIAAMPSFHVLLNPHTQLHHQQQQSNNVIYDDSKVFHAYLDHCSLPITTTTMPTVDRVLNSDHNVVISLMHNQWQHPQQHNYYYGIDGNYKFVPENYDYSLFASTTAGTPSRDVCLNLNNNDVFLHTLRNQWRRWQQQQQYLHYPDGTFQYQVLPTNPMYRQQDEVGRVEKVNRWFRVPESTANAEAIVAPRARFVEKLDKLCRSHSFQMLGFKEVELDF